MTGRGAGQEDADARSVRAAARRTAWQVAAVSSLVVLGILALAALFVLDQSRPTELLERPKPGQSKIYVDAHEVLLALVVLGVGSVAVVGLAGWGISRRAVAPLGEALRMQRSFVADASHELRTPLTVLDLRLQVLQRELDRREAHDDTLAAARRDARVMIDLVTDLLLVAEESARGAGDGADLRAVVLDGVRDIGLLAEARGVRLTVSVEQEARVGLPEVGLRRALAVLIDNAVAHSPAGATVTVTAVVERGRGIVRVQDEGEGVSGVDPARMFDRFAHGPTTTERRGFGIGLALARDLVTRHGGRVVLESTSGRGTVMRLELPIAR